jgi:hypothetical protein
MEWHIIVAAIATSTSLHSVMEPDNIMRKLKRLKTAMDTGEIEELPMKGIDTRLKSLGVWFAILSILIVLSYLAINSVNPSIDNALIYSVLILVLGDFLTTIKIDQYHILIEKITKTTKRKK